MLLCLHLIFFMVVALLALCAGNSPVTGEFPSQRPVTWSFAVFFDLRLNKRLSKQWWGWWFETSSRSVWRHRNVYRCVAYITVAFHGYLILLWETVGFGVSIYAHMHTNDMLNECFADNFHLLLSSLHSSLLVVADLIWFWYFHQIYPYQLEAATRIIK